MDDKIDKTNKMRLTEQNKIPRNTVKQINVLRPKKFIRLDPRNTVVQLQEIQLTKCSPVASQPCKHPPPSPPEHQPSASSKFKIVEQIYLSKYLSSSQLHQNVNGRADS